MFFKILDSVWCKIQGWTFRVHDDLGLDLVLFGFSLFPLAFRGWLIFLGRPPGAYGALACSLSEAELFRFSCNIPSSDNLYPVEVPKWAAFRRREKKKIGGQRHMIKVCSK
jgi:hypothetical protein